MPNLNARVGEAMSAFCGNAQVTEEHIAQLKTIFARIPKSSILPDLRLVPAWIRKIIMSFYEK